MAENENIKTTDSKEGGENKEGTKKVDTKSKGVSEKKKSVDKDTIPLNKFLDLKAELKSNKEKLKAFELDKKTKNEAKLLEEKKFEELLANKEKELLEAQSSLETEKKSRKIANIKNKAINILHSEGSIDNEVALKLLDIDKLLESEDVEKDLKNSITNIKTTKGFLFGTVNTRNKTENGMPGISSQNKAKTAKQNRFMSGLDKATEALKNLNKR